MTDEQRKAFLDIIDECYKTASDHGWWPKNKEVNIPEKLALIHSEVSEALECYRNAPRLSEESGCELNELFYEGEDGDFTGCAYRTECPDASILNRLIPNKPVGFPSELADIVIRVFDLAAHLRIDLPEAIEMKMSYNRTRPYRHGGKAC